MGGGKGGGEREEEEEGGTEWKGGRRVYLSGSSVPTLSYMNLSKSLCSPM